MSEEQFLKQVIPSYFINQPNEIILRRRVKEIINLDFGYFYFNGKSKVDKTLLFDIHGEEFYKINFESEILELRDRKSELKIISQLKDFKMEFYISYGDVNGDFSNPVIMGIDELLYYLTKKMNDRVVKDISFPKLDYLEYDELGDDFITHGRVLRNKYFPEYMGEVFNLFEIDNELKELFAVSSNSLAFLVRFKDRVKGELLVAKEYDQTSNLNIYPRFNNAIAETAGYIYNIWERIIFILNEFFPKKNNNTNYPPSFEQYFTGKYKELEIKVGYFNDEFLWFYDRLTDEHIKLGSLRHPLVHYNKLREVKGMRSAKFMSEFHSIKDIGKTIKDFEDEISFLNAELFNINIALKKSLILIEKWSEIELI